MLGQRSLTRRPAIGMDAATIATITGTGMAGAGLIYAALAYHKRHQPPPAQRPFHPARWRLRRPTHPPIANPRPQPTRRITGRPELLAELRQRLRRGRLVVVHGLGGVGKTQLVLRYLAKHARDYQVVWWVRAEQPTTLAGDLARLASALRLPEQADPDQEVVVDAVRGWLERHAGWLLIFDNADDQPTLARFLPSLGEERRGGRVLVTTRYDLGRDTATVAVRPWPQVAGSRMVFRCGHSALTWPNSHPGPGLVGGGAGPVEMLVDRAQGHELPGRARGHLRAVVAEGQQHRPGRVVHACVDQAVLAGADALQQPLALSRV